MVVILAVHLVIFWDRFFLDRFRGSFLDILTKGTFLSEHSFMVKSKGWWAVAPGIILSSPGTGGTLYFPVPFSIPIFHPQSQSQLLDNS